MASSPTLSRRHLLILPATLLPIARVSAQATPPPLADTPATSMAVTAMLPELPGVLSDVQFRRYTLEPGSAVPEGVLAGAVLMLVRSGEVTVYSDVPVVRRRAGETGPAEASEVPDDGLALGAGEGALVPDAPGLTLENSRSEQAELAALIISSRTEAIANEPQMTGVTLQPLGSGPLTFHEGPAVTIVEQVVVQPGRSAYSTTFKGVEMGALEHGAAIVLCRAGMTWSTPGLLDGGDLPIPGRIPIAAGATMDLAAGDAYASYDGSLVWRSTGDEPLVVLRAQVIPVPQPGR